MKDDKLSFLEAVAGAVPGDRAHTSTLAKTLGWDAHALGHALADTGLGLKSTQFRHEGVPGRGFDLRPIRAAVEAERASRAAAEVAEAAKVAKAALVAAAEVEAYIEEAERQAARAVEVVQPTNIGVPVSLMKAPVVDQIVGVLDGERGVEQGADGDDVLAQADDFATKKAKTYEEGHLVPVSAISVTVPKLNLKGVKTKGGDYSATDLAARLARRRRAKRVAADVLGWVAIVAFAAVLIIGAVGLAVTIWTYLPVLVGVGLLALVFAGHVDAH